MDLHYRQHINTLRLRHNGRHFADDIFKCIFLNENVWIPIKISLKFVPEGPINYIPALVQIMAWRPTGDKPLSETMMVRLLTHICVTRPQWVNGCSPGVIFEVSIVNIVEDTRLPSSILYKMQLYYKTSPHFWEFPARIFSANQFCPNLQYKTHPKFWLWVWIADKVCVPTWSKLLRVDWDFDSPWITGPVTPHQSQANVRHIN